MVMEADSLMLPAYQCQSGRMVVTRRVRFSSGHYLALPEWDEQQNFAQYWKASLQPGHGHNYVIEAAVEGDVDPDTGMVINLRDLKSLLNEHAVERFDFKHLNHQPAFKNKLPAIENIAADLWQRLTPPLLAENQRLRWIAVAEMDDLWGAVIGDDTQLTAEGTINPMATKTFFTKTVHFCAGHRLHNPAWDETKNRDIFGKCNLPNGHGHNYQLDVTVAGQPDERTGLIVDLGQLNAAVQGVADKLDHLNLNTDVPELSGIIPTTENVAKALWVMLSPVIPRPASLYRIRLVETRNNAVEYFGPDSDAATMVAAEAPT